MAHSYSSKEFASNAESVDDPDEGMEDDQWDDWNGSGDEENEPARSLFGPEMLRSPDEAFQHDAHVHGFDLRQYAVQVCYHPSWLA